MEEYALQRPFDQQANPLAPVRQRKPVLISGYVQGCCLRCTNLPAVTARTFVAACAEHQGIRQLVYRIPVGRAIKSHSR